MPRQTNQKVIDLSAVFCVDPDEGQEVWDSLPYEFHLYFAGCFAAQVGLCEAPVEYKGPPVKMPDE